MKITHRVVSICRWKSYGALLDTGCEVTVIPTKLVRRRQLQYTTRTLIADNGTQITIAGWTTIKAFVGSSPVIISGLVSEHVTEIMLGTDWLKENEVQWDFLRGEVTIQGEVYKLAARRTRGDWCRRVVAARDVTIPPCSQLDMPTKAVYHQLQTSSDMVQQEVTWATETSEVRKGLLVARTLLPNRADEIPVRVLNTSNTPVHLCRGGGDCQRTSSSHTSGRHTEPIVPAVAGASRTWSSARAAEERLTDREGDR